MKLPAKIAYAYRAILELSLRYDKNGPVQLSAISEAQSIPKKFLIQLLLRLKNANIVDSTRGTAGGYFLTRHPSQISLADVIRAIDDSIIEPPAQVKGSNASDPSNILSRIWADIAKDMAKRFAGMTFDKLASQINKEQFTYHI